MAFVGLALAALVGCTHAPESRVITLNGRAPVHEVKCEEDSQCYGVAREACPDGYTVEDATPSRDGTVRWPLRAPATVHLDGSLKFTCNADQPACDHAWALHAEVAKWWSERRAGKQAKRPVVEEPFFDACRALPLPAQKCLDRGYRERHAESCADALDELTAADVVRLDVALVATE
jgi:hypothetical protein